MRILVDECSPRALRRYLSDKGHDCRTVQEAGWSGKENGELLDLAETLFDVFVTLDTNIRYQQNLVGRKIGIVALQAQTNRLKDLRPLFEACAAAVETIKGGELVYLSDKAT